MMKKSGEHNMFTTGSRSKKNKSVIEKKRRARINGCLEELKSIVVQSKGDAMAVSKLEKADILEMTLHYIKKFQSYENKRAKVRDSKDYREGYSACANSVLNFLKKNTISDSKTKSSFNIEDLQSLILKQRQKDNHGNQNKRDINANVFVNSEELLANTELTSGRPTTAADGVDVGGFTDILPDEPMTVPQVPQQHMAKVIAINDDLHGVNGKHSVCSGGLQRAFACSDRGSMCGTLQEKWGSTKPEETQTLYQVALLLPTAGKNHTSLVPVYGLIVANPNDVKGDKICSEKECLTQMQNYQNNFQHGSNKYVVNNEKHSDNQIWYVNTSTKFSDAELSEEGISGHFKTDFCASLNHFVENNTQGGSGGGDAVDCKTIESSVSWGPFGCAQNLLAEQNIESEYSWAKPQRSENKVPDINNNNMNMRQAIRYGMFEAPPVATPNMREENTCGRNGQRPNELSPLGQNNYTNVNCQVSDENQIWRPW